MQAAELPRQNYAAVQQVDKLSWQTSFSPKAYRSQWLTNDASYMQLSHVSYGMHSYPLVRTLEARFTPPTFDRSGRFSVADLPKSLVGEGDTPSSANEDFELRFHKEFQRLASLRPFEMSAGDAQTWQVFRSKVDIPQYVAKTPQFSEAYGTVSKVEHSLLIIHWEDGSRDRVDFRRLPANMANSQKFGPGQPFRASIKRSAAGRLVQILSATRCRSAQPIVPEVMTRLRKRDESEQRQTSDWN